VLIILFNNKIKIEWGHDNLIKRKNKRNTKPITLQDFTVFPTDIFVGMWLEVRRWFIYQRPHRRITSVGFTFVGDFPFRGYNGQQNKKTICQWFYRRNLSTKKKRFPLEIYQRIFIPLMISWFTDGYVPSVNLSVSVWNTDRIYPSVNSSVSVAATVKCRIY
jgi:hypothetical protein